MIAKHNRAIWGVWFRIGLKNAHESDYEMQWYFSGSNPKVAPKCCSVSIARCCWFCIECRNKFWDFVWKIHFGASNNLRYLWNTLLVVKSHEKEHSRRWHMFVLLVSTRYNFTMLLLLYLTLLDHNNSIHSVWLCQFKKVVCDCPSLF